MLHFTGENVIVEPMLKCSKEVLQTLDPTKLNLLILVIDEGAC